MRRGTLAAILLLLSQLTFGQAITTHPNANRKLTQAQRQQIKQMQPVTNHASQRSNQHLRMDYAAFDDSIGTLQGDNIQSYEWAINKNFPDDSFNNYNLKWGYVALDSFIDYYSLQTFAFPTGSYQLDSIYIPIRHVHNSGQYDTLIVTEYARTNNSLPSVDGAGLLNGTVLHADTFRVNSALTSGYQYIVLRPNVNIAGGQHVGIGINFHGPLTDSLFMIADHRDKCNAACAAYPTFAPSSYYNMIFFNLGNSLGGVFGPSNSLYYDCNGSGSYEASACENFYLQNFNLSAFVTANVVQGPPVADFVVSPTTPTANSAVTFLDRSTNSPTSWSWSFPGASPSSSTAQNPTGIIFPAAGNYQVTLAASNATSSNTVTKTITIALGTNGCDTLFNLTAQDIATVYLETNGLGYVAGNNGFGDKAKAEFFYNPLPGSPINQVFMIFGVATYANASDTIMAAIWDANGIGGAPGNMLDHVSLNLADISNDVQNLVTTIVNFPGSSIPSGNFYVGVVLPTRPGDTVAFISNQFDSLRTAHTAWEMQSSGQWVAMSDSASWQLNLSLGVGVEECGQPQSNCAGFMVTASAVNDSCNSGAGAVSVAASGGLVPYTYAWDSGQSAANISGLYAGIYTVTVTDLLGCTFDTTLTVGNTCNDIWPGDADNNGVADANDVFQISVEYGSTGPVRQNPTLQWVAQGCNDWAGVTFGINDKYADCDGNGIINVNDTLAVSQNYGLTHQKTTEQNQAQQTDPVLSLVSEQDSIQAGGTAKFRIMLGDAGNTISSLYGVAFSINYDPTVFNENNISISTTNSWLGTAGTNMFTFRKLVAADGRLDVVLARTNHQNTNGYGQVGELQLGVNNTMPNGGAANTIVLSPIIIKGIQANLTPLTFNTKADSVTVVDSTTGISTPTLSQQVSIYPNPSSGHFVLDIAAPLSNATWQLTDITGKQLQSGTLPAQANTHKEMDLSTHAKGIYLLKLVSDQGTVIKRVIVQ